MVSDHFWAGHTGDHCTPLARDGVRRHQVLVGLFFESALGKTMEQKMELALDKMLSKEQVAEIFGIKPKTVYTWVANGKLSKPDVISTRYSRFPLSRVKQDYFRQFGRDLILKE